MQLAGRLLGLVLGGLLVSGCSSDRPEGGGGPGVDGLSAARDSPLYVAYPELDQRIVCVDLRRTLKRRTYFPDRWLRSARAVRDFAVDRARLYALLAARDRDVAQLFVVGLADGKLQRKLALAPVARLVAWAGDHRLLVGHDTPPHGPGRGGVSVVDTRSLRVARHIALPGGVGSLVGVAGGRRAFAVVRTTRRTGPQRVLHLDQLFELDLERGRVAHHLALPTGARQVAIGPGGRLYVSHSSGLGLHATDATVSVIEPRALRLTSRLRVETIVRRMLVVGDRLVTSQLSRTGEVWLAALRGDRTTAFDFRFEKLVHHELAAVGDIVYVPRRHGDVLERIDVAGEKRLEPLVLSKPRGYQDRPAMLRTVMTGTAGRERGDRAR